METKLRMIELLDEHREGIHLRELSRLLGTGLPNVVRHAKILENESVLRRRKDANLVKLRLKKGPRTVAYLKQIHTERFLALPEKIQVAITDFLDELEAKPLILLVFGSYAKGHYTKDSDIDLLLVFQEVGDGKPIEHTAKRVGMKTNTTLHPVYLDYSSFEKNLLSKEHDFSREIRHKVIVMSGTELYYSLLWRFLA